MKYVVGKIRFCPICKKNILECQCNVDLENSVKTIWHRIIFLNDVILIRNAV